MQNAEFIIVTDVGEYELPAAVRSAIAGMRLRQDGQPDRRYALGKRLHKYTRDACFAAVRAYALDEPFRLPDVL